MALTRLDKQTREFTSTSLTNKRVFTFPPEKNNFFADVCSSTLSDLRENVLLLSLKIGLQDDKKYDVFLAYHFSQELDKFARDAIRDSITLLQTLLESLGFSVHDANRAPIARGRF